MQLSPTVKPVEQHVDFLPGNSISSSQIIKTIAKWTRKETLLFNEIHKLQLSNQSKSTKGSNRPSQHSKHEIKLNQIMLGQSSRRVTFAWCKDCYCFYLACGSQMFIATLLFDCSISALAIIKKQNSPIIELFTHLPGNVS